MTNDSDVQENLSIDSILAHSRIADYYQFRPAYTNEFILSVSKKMHLSGSEILLDLCCGRGELANEFARFSKNVFAVDGSPEMLKHKIPGENITYIQCDLNQEELILPSKASWALIGSAIHWLDRSAIQKIVDENLTGDKKFLVTHRILKMNDEQYYQSLKNLDVKFGKTDRFTKLDFIGTKIMDACGYRKDDELVLSYDVNFGLEYLINAQLSKMYGIFYDKVSTNLFAYKNELTKTLTPFLVEGKLQAKLINLAVIYAPQ